jgi:Recombination endonuclease VII
MTEKQRRRHGLGRDGIDALLDAQGRSCAICGVPYADRPGHRLAMDHDHTHCPGPVGCPLCVRGMLCNHCNNLLRLAKDSPEHLMKAAMYLTEQRAALLRRQSENGSGSAPKARTASVKRASSLTS